MARSIATNTTVELAEPRLRPATPSCCSPPPVATAARRSSPVSGGVDLQGRIVISTYPARAKTRNAERDPRVSVLVSDDWNGPWVQVDGDAEVLHMPEAADGLVDYFRCIAGEHPDWEEYREAMRIQDKSPIRITPSLGSDRYWRIPGRRGRPTRLADQSGCEGDVTVGLRRPTAPASAGIEFSG